jgi:hypothetical protein
MEFGRLAIGMVLFMLCTTRETLITEQGDDASELFFISADTTPATPPEGVRASAEFSAFFNLTSSPTM